VTNSTSADPRVGGPIAWWIWTLSVAFVVLLFSVQTGYAIVNANVQTDIGLTLTQVTTIAATYTWVFALFQFYGGALLDRLGARKVLPASIALVTLGIFIFANAKSFEVLLLSQAILAIGSCTGFVGAGYIGGRWFGLAKFSFMFGLVQVVAALTSAMSQNAIEASLEHTTWRELFNIVGISGVVLFALGAIFIKDPAPVGTASHGGVLGFLSSVTRSLFDVAKIPHVLISSLVGAALFGVLLAVGVIYAPKLLQARGVAETTAVLGSSMIWLGLAVGSAIVPWWSDKIRQRKMPIVLGSVVQLAAFAIMVYMPGFSAPVELALCFIFGFANASHMLAFSTAADVVQPSQIGTSAAIVNGAMFIVGGLMMSRPGVRADRAVEQGMAAGSMDLVQYAALPLLLALAVALIFSLVMRETHPQRTPQA